MSEDHILRMAEQIGELNGSVKALTDTVQNYVTKTEQSHKAHAECCTENKVAIGRINARHATYWKVIGSVGGLGGILALFSKGSGH